MSEWLNGSCHCGAVKFQVRTPVARAVRCNCSLCRRKGVLMSPAFAAEHLKIVSGKEELTLYQFNTRVAKHYFCRLCGIYPFHQTRLDLRSGASISAASKASIFTRSKRRLPTARACRSWSRHETHIRHCDVSGGRIGRPGVRPCPVRADRVESPVRRTARPNLTERIWTSPITCSSSTTTVVSVS